LTSLVTTITETLRYRGAIGQWSWVLHRVTGLGVVLFLTLHVIDTSWAVFWPALYEKAIAVYQTPLFTLGEFALTASVIYHALNGVRIALFDFRPEWWKHQAKAAQLVLLGTVLILIPTFLAMFGHVLTYYNSSPQMLSVLEVLREQIPFVIGIGGAVALAVILAVRTQPILSENKKPTQKPRGSRLERFWWSFMRASGIAIVPLVFGHLAMIHLIQGVFEITAASHVAVATDLVNVSGTATEFVAHRWNFLFAGVAIWRLYDIALLALVTVHGFNGLRYVLTDYTTQSPVLRRAATYLVTIGAAVLLAVGGAALIGTIEPSAITIAEEAQARLFGEEGAEVMPAEEGAPEATEAPASGG